MQKKVESLKEWINGVRLAFQTEAGKWVGKGFWILCLAIGTNIVMTAWRGYNIGAEFDSYKRSQDMKWTEQRKLDSLNNMEIHKGNAKIDNLNGKVEVINGKLDVVINILDPNYKTR